MTYLEWQWEILQDTLRQQGHKVKERRGKWMEHCNRIIVINAEDGYTYAWKLTDTAIKLEEY